MQQTKYVLDEKAIPESWYNLVPDLPFAAGAAAESGHQGACRARGVRPDLPAGDHRAGSDVGVLRPHPRRGA